MSHINSILVAEDDGLIALHIASVVEDVGCKAVIVDNVADGLRELDNEIMFAAILDFELKGGNATALIHQLKTLGINFAVASGSSLQELLKAGVDRPYIFAKPCSYEEIVGGLLH
jgi:DNA-binding response OmpR family regulator